ncbi:MAG: hypothetical protein ABI554_06475 [Flavobacterium sp.]
MLKNFINLILISCLLISCKENNTSLTVKGTKSNKIGIVANVTGSNIYNEDTITSEKIGKLKYAEKIDVVNLNQTKNLLHIKFNGKDAYIVKKDIEIISTEVYKKSYFSKDCYCLLGSNKIKTINFPTKYDTIHFLFNNDKINMVQQILYYRSDNDNEEKKNKIDTKKLGYSAVYKYIDKNNFYSCQVIDPNKSESFLDCYSTKTNYTIKNNKTTLSHNYGNVVYELYFAENLFNLDVSYAKINYEDFVRPLNNFDFKSQNLIIEQDMSQINKNIPIQLYDVNTNKAIVYNKSFLSFNYLREIKIIEKKGKKKYMAKVNVLESIDSDLSGQYYIDLKEVAMFASIPE